MMFVVRMRCMRACTCARKSSVRRRGVGRESKRGLTKNKSTRMLRVQWYVSLTATTCMRTSSTMMQMEPTKITKKLQSQNRPHLRTGVY